MEIKKIRKMGRQKIITIPKESDMQLGDYVQIIKLKDEKEREAIAQ